MSAPPIDPGADIGHVHLKVADLDRSIRFYHGVLGFEVMQRWGGQAAFLSAGGYHHHIGLNTWESAGGAPPPPGSTGLFHVAIRYPERAQLADALRRLLEAGIELDGASDHGVSEALYLQDPDANGVELYWDRPREAWPRPRDGEGVEMFTRALDVRGLLAELRLAEHHDRGDRRDRQRRCGEGRDRLRLGAVARLRAPPDVEPVAVAPDADGGEHERHRGREREDVQVLAQTGVQDEAGVGQQREGGACPGERGPLVGERRVIAGGAHLSPRGRSR